MTPIIPSDACAVPRYLTCLFWAFARSRGSRASPAIGAGRAPLLTWHFGAVLSHTQMFARNVPNISISFRLHPEALLSN